MKKFVEKWIAIFLAVSLAIGMAIWDGMPVYASMADEAIDYTLGETYREEHSYYKYYTFTLTEKSHISLNTSVSGGTVDFAIYNANGKKFMAPGNVTYEHNVTTDVYKGKASRTLASGTYYLEIYTWSRKSYYFNIQAEKLIQVPKGVINSVKSSKSGQMTVSCQKISDAIGYKIQYSTDYRFRKGVKTVYSPDNIKSITKLSKGKRYYIRVAPYTVYSDGEYALGGISYVKSVAVKK